LGVRLEPLLPAELASLYGVCTEDGDRALKWQPDMVWKPAKLTRKRIQRDHPDHPHFKAVDFFYPEVPEKASEQVALDEELQRLRVEFVKRYEAKQNMETAIKYAVHDGHLPTHVYEVPISTAWKDQFRRATPVMRPADFVAWALKHGADLPAELLALVERHEEPAPVGAVEASATEEAGESPVDEVEDQRKAPGQVGRTHEKKKKVPPKVCPIDFDVCCYTYGDLQLDIINGFEIEVRVKGKFIETISPDDLGLRPARGETENKAFTLLKTFARNHGILPKRPPDSNGASNKFTPVQSWSGEDGYDVEYLIKNKDLHVKPDPIDPARRRLVRNLRDAMRGYFPVEGNPIDYDERNANKEPIWRLKPRVLMKGAVPRITNG